MTMIVNNTFRTQRDLMMQVRLVDMAGKSKLLTQVFSEAGPTMAKNYIPIGPQVNAMRKADGVFLSLRLVNEKQQIVSDNFYWLPDSTGTYSGLQHMGKATPGVTVSRGRAANAAQTRFTVTLRNPANGPVAFFNRLSLVDAKTKQRLLPVFYSDNYFSILPGETKTVMLDYTPRAGETPMVSVRGWNVEENFY
jgi:hypothetical protein